MKQHIKTLILFLVLLALLPVGVLATGASLPAYYQESYYAELDLMYQRLKNSQGPKILVVGGSNVAFGLDSGLMEDLLAEKGKKYTVCSFGLYAAVGTSAMLDLSLDTLKTGDIVVLAMEPTSETLSSYFGATAFWKCAEDAPHLLTKVGREKHSALFGNYIPYLQERFEIYTTGELPKVEGVYAKSSFDERCDLVYERAGNAMALGYDTATPVDLAAVRIEAKFAQQVNEYVKAAQKKGATVVFSFSPLNRSALVGEKTGVEDFFQLCNETFDCPIISDPNRYILDSGWFYDSNFHLNTPGAVVRTVMLTEDVLAYLGDYEKVEYPMPEMPASIAQQQASTVETKHFIFESIYSEDFKILGYRVSGLMPSGIASTELTVPAVYRGLPVVGFAPGALDQATALTQLRLPETVESLPDGLFQNCKALTLVILEHKTKTCMVTEHTFDGADQIRFLVPAESYPMYRDGVGCTTNPWTIYLDRIVKY